MRTQIMFSTTKDRPPDPFSTSRDYGTINSATNETGLLTAHRLVAVIGNGRRPLTVDMLNPAPRNRRYIFRVGLWTTKTPDLRAFQITSTRLVFAVTLFGFLDNSQTAPYLTGLWHPSILNMSYICRQLVAGHRVRGMYYVSQGMIQECAHFSVVLFLLAGIHVKLGGGCESYPAIECSSQPKRSLSTSRVMDQSSSSSSAPPPIYNLPLSPVTVLISVAARLLALSPAWTTARILPHRLLPICLPPICY